MKKFSLVLISIFMLALSSVLMACNFKDMKVKFIKGQEVLDVTESRNLDDFLQVENGKKEDVTFVFSNPSIFSLSGHMVSSKEGKSGRGYVYAYHDGNNLAMMELVIRRPFDAPKNVRWDERGFVTWDAVFGIFDGETSATYAQKYEVQVEKIIRGDNGQEIGSTPQSQVVSNRTFVFPEGSEGEFRIRVAAKGEGFFSDGTLSDPITVYVNHMPRLSKEGALFEDGKLTWNTDVLAEMQPKFQLRFEGQLVGEVQSEASFDLTSILDSDDVAFGQHSVSVVVFDDSQGENKKLATESETIYVTKLKAPKVEYKFDAQEGGQLEISSEDGADNFDITLKSDENSFTYSFANTAQNSVLTSFDAQQVEEELPAGTYTLEISERKQDTAEMFFFRSKTKTLETKILKLEKASLAGENAESDTDGAVFHAFATRQDGSVATRFLLEKNGEVEAGLDPNDAGFDSQATEKHFDITLSQNVLSGVFDFALRQAPAQAENMLGEENVFVLNSDLGVSTEFVKLPKVTGFVHSYRADPQGQVSVLTFDTINLDDKNVTWTLKVKVGDHFEAVDSEKIESVETGEKISYVLKGRVEELFDPANGQYAFAVEANTQSPEVTIGSLTSQEFGVLKAPVAETQSDGYIWAETPFGWRSAEGDSPAEYRLEIYSLTKSVFEANRANKDSFNPQVVDGVTFKEAVVQSERSYQFGEGYYFVKIFALVGKDESKKVSSHDFLPVLIGVKKQLSIDSVKFGVEEGTYFVEIGAQDANIQTFEIFVDDQQKTYSKSNGATAKYMLDEDFAEEKTYQIRVVAHGAENDDEIFVVAEQSFEVVRLAKVTTGDLHFDDKDARKLLLKIQNGVGTQKVEVQSAVLEAQYLDGKTQISLEGKTDVKLALRRISVTQDLSFVEQGSTKRVYLSSAESNLKIKRLDAPTALEFNEGVLKFKHLSTDLEGIQYTLDVVFQTETQGNLSVRIFLNEHNSPSEVKVEFEDPNVYPSNEREGNLTVSSRDGGIFRVTDGGVEVLIENLFEALSGMFNSIGQYYNNAKSVKVEAWATYDSKTGDTYTISSPLAQTDSHEKSLTIGKMPNVLLQFNQNGEELSLSWNPIDADPSILALTQYLVKEQAQGEENVTVETIVADSAGLKYVFGKDARFEQETGKTFTYFIKATNPKLLASKNSNKIVIFKNNEISQLTAKNDGTLSFRLPGTSSFSAVEVKMGEDAIDVQTYLDMGSVSIKGAGQYSFQVKGKESTTYRDGQIYYLDSDVVTWEVKTLSSVKKEPLSVKFAGNVISWEYPFMEEKLNLEYVLYFQDENQMLLTYRTTAEETQQKQVDFKSNVALRDGLAPLAPGKISVQVLAHLLERTVGKGETIFFEEAQRLPFAKEEDPQEFNYFILEEVKEISRLTKPKIVDFKFDENASPSDTDEDGWLKRQNPSIDITISGNYGEGATFSVYLNDLSEPLSGIKFNKGEEGQYSFQITSEQYAGAAQNGQIFKIYIYAIDGGEGSGVGSIPSEAEVISIVRASQIRNVEFLADTSTRHGVGRVLELTVDGSMASQFAGEVVLRLDYTEREGSSAVKFMTAECTLSANKLSLSDEAAKALNDFIDENLSKGGTLKISAYVDNYVSLQDNVFVMSCSEAQPSVEYTVLQSVTAENVGRTGEGFAITGLENDNNTIYVVEYKNRDGGTNTEQLSHSDAGFVFEIPDEWASDASTFDIYAVHDGDFVRSKKTTITFSLARLDKVGAVELKRNGEALELQWDKVDGATGYVVRAYALNAKGDKEGDALCEFEISGNEQEKIVCTLAELFGENYASLSDKDLTKDFAVTIEITALGDTSNNNSLPQQVNATIQGNSISHENGNIYVSDGVAHFKGQEGKKYRYRFVTPNSAQGLTAWALVPENGILDTFAAETFANMDSPRFDIEIFVYVDENVSTNSNFVFDSVIYSTQNDDDFTFEKLAGIQQVVYANAGDESEEVNFSRVDEKVRFKLVESARSIQDVFAGIEANALTNGKAVRLTLESEENNIFSISLFDILNKFKEENIDFSDATKIYFWAYKESEDATKYVCSQVYDQFVFAVETGFAVKDVKRLQELRPVEDGSLDDEGKLANYVAGWTNTFLLFDDTDNDSRTTVGINVKIKHLDSDIEFTYFVEKANFETNLQQEKTFGININEILNKNLSFTIEAGEETQEISLPTLFGRFAISLMKVSVVAEKNCVSDWISTFGNEELIFQKLRPIQDIQLDSGNLYWRGNNSEDAIDEYYVYFFELDESGAEASCKIIRPGQKLDDDGETIVPQIWLKASDFVLEGNSYHLAVQSVDYDDKFVLASNVTYKTINLDGTGEKSVIYKNHMNTNDSPLKLKENGILTIDWAENDDDSNNFITALKLQGEYADKTYGQLAEAFATKVFTSPFTFSLKDLLSGEVKIKLRFMPVGDSLQGQKTFVIDSFVILQDLVKYYKTLSTSTQLDDLLDGLDGPFGDDVKALMQDFASKIKSKKSGIGDSTTFMDDYFEALQAGQYTLQYCLLGNSHTLNSEWYGFVNAETQENLFGVNAAPSVEFITIPQEETDSNLLNAVQVKIKGSIDADETVKFAEKYFLRLNKFSFEIAKIEETYKLKLVSESDERTVSVKEEGSYLSFFLNLNEGDSLLGVFGDIIPSNNQQFFEICAVGDSTYLSSKSDVFNVTFLSFTNFGIQNGQFHWATPSNEVKTKIVVKQKDNAILYPKTIGDSNGTSTFSLDSSFGAGMYEYIKFVLTVDKKDVKDNVVFVDSDVYVVKNVYKLAAPTLTNDMGYIGITTTKQNYDALKDIYSDGNAFAYQIQNDVSINSAVVRGKFEDERPMADRANEYLYSPGVTGWTREGDSDDWYEYKLTEPMANHFDVKALGTTATLRPIAQDFSQASEGHYIKDYHIRDLYCLNGDELVLLGDNAYVATSSEFGKGIDARMMESVQNVRVENGMLAWDGVTGHTDEELPETATIVYRVDIERYTVALDGVTKNFVEGTDTAYTTKTAFDLSTLKKDQYSGDNIMFRATVRSLVLDKNDAKASVTLQDGTTAGGNVKFVSNKFVLMSEGFVKDGFSRLPAVKPGSVKVQDRELVWEFSTTDTTLTAENFKEYLDFVVMDNPKGQESFEILGDFSVSLGTESGGVKTFLITFNEQEDNAGKEGSLSGGEHDITVYVTKAEGRKDEVVRSFGESAKITKLATVTEADFAIETNYVNQLETLNLENYFASHPDKAVTAKFVVGDVETEVVLTNSEQKIYILRSEDDQVSFEPDDKYSQTKIVIGENVEASVSFVVTGDTTELSSDRSEAYNLSRTAWQGEASLEWDATSGEFSWEIEEGVSEFVIEATYTYSENSQEKTIKRIYHSSDKVFKPTIIGKVALSVRVKFNNNSLQSEALSHIVGDDVQTGEDGLEFVNFNLFSSGMGTQEKPYVIGGYEEGSQLPTNEQQFKNIVYRQTKQEQYLLNFVQIDDRGNSNEEEEAKYYFRLACDVNLGDVKGILFAGNFAGDVDGAGHTITYTSSTNQALKNAVQIDAEENAAEIQTGVRDITFTSGSALFETLTSSANVHDLKIDVKFGSEHSIVAGFSIMAGLAILNNGNVSDITLTRFESTFVAQGIQQVRDVMVYAGLVGRNMGEGATIKNCSVNTNISISDQGQMQFIFVSGIVYTNDAIVTGCTSGEDGQEIRISCSSSASFVQVAGIAITNAASGGEKMTRCTNNFDITVEGPSGNGLICYMAGVVVLGQNMGSITGTENANHNTGKLTAWNTNTNSSIVADGEGVIGTTSVRN